MGDAFHRGGPRMDAYLALGTEMHRRALRFRCVGAASVLWAWLAGGQIQGMVLVAQQPVRRRRRPRDRAGGGRAWSPTTRARRSTLGSAGAMAAVPGVHGELVALAAELARAT